MTDQNVIGEEQPNVQPHEEKDYKKIAYAAMGRSIQAEKKSTELEIRMAKMESQIQNPKVDTTGYDPDQVKLIEQLAEQKAKEIISQSYTQPTTLSTEQKEEEAFLYSHPEAYEYLDEIRRVRNLMPSRSLKTIWNGFYGQSATPAQEQRPTPANMGSNTAPAKSGQSQEDDLKALDDEFNKLIGR